MNVTIEVTKKIQNEVDTCKDIVWQLHKVYNKDIFSVVYIDMYNIPNSFFFMGLISWGFGSRPSLVSPVIVHTFYFEVVTKKVAKFDFALTKLATLAIELSLKIAENINKVWIFLVGKSFY